MACGIIIKGESNEMLESQNFHHVILIKSDH